jgi:hypothetical protein
MNAWNKAKQLILYPIKTIAMNLIRTNPVYAAIAVLLFLQIPILIAGNSVPASKAATREYLSAYGIEPVVLSKEEQLEQIADSLYDSMELLEAGLNEKAFELAYKGYAKLVEEGKVSKDEVLTIADFSKPSHQNRLFVIDMDHLTIKYKTLVAHGRNSGLTYANQFSNKPESNKSSLGFYLTLNTYIGGKGYSLKLKGLEKGVNDKAYDRAIVMHGSDYVSAAFARSNGYLGRSLGCPAIPTKLTKSIINTIKSGSLMFIYHPDKNYIQQSAVLNS